jgi:Tfp pilus assembly protein PilV
MIKKHYGFSILEVLIALSIAMVLIAPLFNLQGFIMRQTGHMSNTTRRTLVAQNFLISTRAQIPEDTYKFSQEKKISDINLTLLYTLNKPDKKSSIAKQNNVYQETVTMTYKENNNTKRNYLVSFVYKKPQPEEQKT